MKYKSQVPTKQLYPDDKSELDRRYNSLDERGLHFAFQLSE